MKFTCIKTNSCSDIVLADLTLSIVSHGQAALIQSLLRDLAALPHHDFEVLITLNLPEDESVYQGFPFPLRIIRNNAPKGFGGNHNAAFRQSRSQFFAVVNPDIRIRSLDIDKLISPFVRQEVAAVAPVVLSGSGEIEDSARRFPTLLRFAKRVVLRQCKPDYIPSCVPYSVDWVAGMFIVFRGDVYERIGGFDDRRFFMYLEDTDICRRIHKDGWQVMLNPKVSVYHMAQRSSHRNIKHMRWHVVSAFRYLSGL